MILINKKSLEYLHLLNTSIYKQAKDLIGVTFHSNSGRFIVLDITGKKNSDGRKLYKIKFLTTGEIGYYSKKRILNGDIKDYMYPSLCGIGYLGKDWPKLRDQDPLLAKVMRARWKCIIRRCTLSTDFNYINYGAKGVTIDPEWYCLSTFYTDIINTKGFDRDLFVSGYLEIDKDLKQSDVSNKKYSKDTISLVTHEDNMKSIDQNKIKRDMKYFVVINNDGSEYLKQNICEFARLNNINKVNISSILNSRKNGTAGGYRYRFPSDDEYKLIESGKIHVNDRIF